MTKKYRVCFLRDLRKQYGDPLPGSKKLLEDDEIEVTHAAPRDHDEIEPSDLRGFNAAISMTDDIRASSLEGVDSLELVVRSGAGFENLDIQSLTNHGIIASHAPQGPTQSVAQATVGMLITCAHNLKEFDHLVRTDPEKAVLNRADYMGHELSAKTLGILGLGQIGKTVVELLKPFDMNICVYDPYLEESKAEALGVKKTGLNSLLSIADYITLHVPRTDETKYMLGKDEFKQMKDSAYLINTSRGGLYEDDVLVEALQKGWIAGAAIDVYEDEPFIEDNPLREVDHALLTPHISGITFESMERIISICADSIIRMKNGEFPRFIINPESVEDTEIPEEYLSPAFIR